MTQYRRNPGFSETAVDGEAFLVDPDNDEIYYLDQITTGLWQVLSEPKTRSEILILFSAAFPDVDVDRLDADLIAALADMVARGLVIAE